MRVRTPTVIQMEATECGAASLGIVLGYYGCHVPLEELRMECGVSRDGSNAFNVVQAAKRYGLTGEGHQLSAEELSTVETPAILFWEFNHFVVLEGITKNKVYLNDPAYGPRFISLDELKASYAGIVLTFRKNEQFQKRGGSSSLFGQMARRLSGAKRPLLFLVTSGTCLLLPGLILPALLMAFLEFFFANDAVPWGKGFLAIVLLTALFAGLLTWLQQRTLSRLYIKLAMRFASDFLWHMLQLPMSFYTQRYPGEIAYRMTLNDSVAETLTGPLLSGLINVLLISVYALVMLAYNVPIALIGFAAGAISLASMVGIFRSRASAYVRLQQELGKTVGYSIGGVQQIETIKAKGVESTFFAKWAGYYTNVLNTTQEVGRKDVALSILPPFFQLLALAALLGFGSLRITEGAMTTGELMALQMLLMNFLAPINKFVGLNTVLQNMRVDLGRLDDVMNNAPDPLLLQRSTKSSAVRKLQGRLEFRHVSFRYAPLAPLVLDDISFVIEPGQRIAFVGPSGSGKSTIAKLATGLLTPTAGEILYDGTPLSDIPSETFRSSVASVDQDIFLFSGTIRDNLSLWNSKVHEDMLIDAASDAAIHEEILLRGGYDAELIEGGKNISGGQRQRMEIARAFLYHPTLLILDEATSALDSKTESFISDKIRHRGCAALQIAHRLSTIQDCDEIIVLDKGQIVQRGHHEELKGVEGLYKTLVGSEVCFL